MKNLTASLLTGFVSLLATAVYAGNATWNLNPTNSDWNTAANWTPATVPGPSDVATLSASNTTNLSVSTYSAVDELLFSPEASAFTLTAPPSNVIEIGSGGIMNNSGVTQSFVATVDDNGNSGAIAFTGNGSASSNTIFTINARRSSSGNTGDVEFVDFASASEGIFIIQGGEVNGSIGGQARFFANSSGGNATFTNNGGVVSGTVGGTTSFFNL